MNRFRTGACLPFGAAFGAGFFGAGLGAGFFGTFSLGVAFFGTSAFGAGAFLGAGFFGTLAFGAGAFFGAGLTLREGEGLVFGLEELGFGVDFGFMGWCSCRWKDYLTRFKLFDLCLELADPVDQLDVSQRVA